MNKTTQHVQSQSRSIRQPPASGQRPKLVTRQNVTTALQELIDYHRRFERFFQRREQSDWSWFYLCGQLSNLERKTIEPMVLSLLGAIPNAIRDLQRFMSQSSWDVRSPMLHLQSLVAKWLGEREAVVIVDGSGFPKQGKHSIGVAYQYCGHLGKIANCQQGVFLAYASRRGYSFLDERLYLPQEWFATDHRQLCEACGLPESIHFQTEGELALGMLRALNQGGVVPFQWVAYDESYGKNPAFSQEIAAMHKWYMAEVPSDTRVWLRTPLVEEPGRGLMGRPRLHRRVRRSASAPEELRALVVSLLKAAWHRRLIHEGSTRSSEGRLCDFACDPDPRPLASHPPMAHLSPQSGAATRIEVLFEQRSFALLDSRVDPHQRFALADRNCARRSKRRSRNGSLHLHPPQVRCETRTWLGWHHHMFQTFMAHLFLTRLRLIFKKNFLHSPLPRLGNWWPQPSQKKPSFPVTTYLRSITINDETMKPTAPIATTIIISTAHRQQYAPATKRRCNIRNVVVM